MHIRQGHFDTLPAGVKGQTADPPIKDNHSRSEVYHEHLGHDCLKEIQLSPIVLVRRIRNWRLISGNGPHVKLLKNKWCKGQKKLNRQVFV